MLTQRKPVQPGCSGFLTFRQLNQSSLEEKGVYNCSEQIADIQFISIPLKLAQVPGLPSGMDETAFLQDFHKGWTYLSQAEMGRACSTAHFPFPRTLQMHLEDFQMQW